MALDLGALANALGMGAIAGNKAYNEEEDAKRKERLEALAERRQAALESRQALLDQSTMDRNSAQVRANDALADQRLHPPARPWAPQSEDEALDYNGKLADRREKARARYRPARGAGAGSTAGQITPRMRQTFLQQRLQYHLNPRADAYGDPIEGTGLDAEAARAAAEADVEAAYGPSGEPTVRDAAPAGGVMIRGGGSMFPKAPTRPAKPGADAAPPAAAPSPPAAAPDNAPPPATVTHSSVGQDPNASLDPTTGRPLRALTPTERAAAKANYIAPGKTESFQQMLLKRGYKPKDWQ